MTNTQVIEQAEEITYVIDNVSFIVTPVYQDSPGKTVQDILLALMEKDCENR